MSCLNSLSMFSASLPDMMRADDIWWSRPPLASSHSTVAQHLTILSPISSVIAHAASRARADASFVLIIIIGSMAAFWGPKQVNIAPNTLRELLKA